MKESYNGNKKYKRLGISEPFYFNLTAPLVLSFTKWSILIRNIPVLSCPRLIDLDCR